MEGLAVLVVGLVVGAGAMGAGWFTDPGAGPGGGAKEMGGNAVGTPNILLRFVLLGSQDDAMFKT